MKVLLKIIIGCFIFLLALALITITTVNWTPYKETAYYKETLQALEDLTFEGADKGYVLSGWSKANITAESPVNLVAYKPRGPYEYVEDSSFVKAIIIGNAQFKVAFLNYELLIVHPELAKALSAAIKKQQLPVDHVYFTATHTHSGMGGTIPGPVGELAMGGWDESLVSHVTNGTLKAIDNALVNMDTVSLRTKRSEAADFVSNRLIPSDPIDPYIRQLTLEKSNGETCTLVTYSAHATCLSSKFMGLSGDYPYYLTEALEKRHDFAVFAAGAVGSHRPKAPGNDIKSIKQYASSLDSVVNSKQVYKKVKGTHIMAANLPLKLRSPHYRISDNLRLRPWLFNWAIGESPAYFDVIRIGNALFISSSGEISGVFYKAWEAQAEALGLSLFITTFNGGYIGYITPDKYYSGDYYEARDMNFYGPYNGEYFKEIVSDLIGLGANL
ncbi:neutral/alkaline non-lysosomal ceramidase N-terminal domain-containing protein [uncultured Cyclobacterium sp.]|uniref:neutral/alkaline non-lysosomal ceramidase N-terminal domain-containing protein n=1 Tax=uncultured Cyclobacterium sp. TaxID=453820 RepID=UPI0030EE9CA8|tara:strand:+ start:73081 stop:74409 length:1329 start_codon:yes stop_codon:yes gene_type:complete